MNISKAVLDNVTPQIEELKRKRAHAVEELAGMNAEIARLETLQYLSEPVMVANTTEVFQPVGDACGRG